jgi:hypothetical protein
LHDQQALLTKNTQASSQRLAGLKTDFSKQLEGINKHLGELEEEVNQVNSAVAGLLHTQDDVSQAMFFARRADEHVTG